MYNAIEKFKKAAFSRDTRRSQTADIQVKVMYLLWMLLTRTLPLFPLTPFICFGLS